VNALGRRQPPLGILEERKRREEREEKKERREIERTIWS